MQTMLRQAVERRHPVRGGLAIAVDADDRRCIARSLDRMHCQSQTAALPQPAFLSSCAFLADACKASSGFALRSSVFWICCWVKRSHSLCQGALMLSRALAVAYCWARMSGSWPAAFCAARISGSESMDLKA